MFEMLVTSATAGFGASFGRDLYKAAKKNPIVLGIVGALLLAFGWRNMFLGYGRSFLYVLFVNIIGSIIMIAVGSVLLLVPASMASGMFFNDAPGPKIAVVLASIGVLSLVGILWGRRDRRALIRQSEIEVANFGFLHEHGFSESEFESDQIIDPDGHRLKLIEHTDDRLVFSVLGRRGLRAAIKLDGGQMVDYTGVQKAA